MPSDSEHPHSDQPLLDTGTPLEEASAALILLHGRGASARSILTLSDELDIAGLASLAPQAAQRSWYPNSFMAPIESNEPHLTSALRILESTIEKVTAAGLTEEQVVLLGFSQGACLATEFAARNPQRYGGIVGLSGGLIGPEGTEFDVEGTLDGTPVFLGCSDQDPYIPLERVEETADVFRRLSAKVTKKIYEGMGHTTNEDEIQHIRSMLKDLVE